MYTVDIKVLRAVHILVTCGSVTKAAEILNVTPGAVTYLINKARKATGSALFFRTKNGMLPDNVAKVLSLRYIKFANAFEENDKKLMLGNREVTISTYALIELMIAIRLNDSITEDKICFSSLSTNDESRLIKLRNREVDIDIGTRLPPDRSIISSMFFNCGVKVIARKGLMEKNTPLTLKDWMSKRHIMWSRGMHLICDNHDKANQVYDILSQRDIYCVTSNSSNMIMMASYTDNFIIMPEIIVDNFIDKLPIDVFDLPVEMNIRYECYVHYHCSMIKDPLINGILKTLRNNVFNIDNDGV